MKNAFLKQAVHSQLELTNLIGLEKDSVNALLDDLFPVETEEEDFDLERLFKAVREQTAVKSNDIDDVILRFLENEGFDIHKNIFTDVFYGVMGDYKIQVIPNGKSNLEIRISLFDRVFFEEKTIFAFSCNNITEFEKMYGIFCEKYCIINNSLTCKCKNKAKRRKRNKA